MHVYKLCIQVCMYTDGQFVSQTDHQPEVESVYSLVLHFPPQPGYATIKGQTSVLV